MTPEERDRLVKLETSFSILTTTVKHIDEKVDKLIAAANMGRGVFWVLMKFGGFLVVLTGAAAWLLEYFERKS